MKSKIEMMCPIKILLLNIENIITIDPQFHSHIYSAVKCDLFVQSADIELFVLTCYGIFWYVKIYKETVVIYK